jgi:xylose isomerase
VQEALEASGATELAEPTLGPDESWQGLRADRGAYEEFDVDRAAGRGYGVARIDQLMVEHLLGARRPS